MWWALVFQTQREEGRHAGDFKEREQKRKRERASGGEVGLWWAEIVPGPQKPKTPKPQKPQITK